ncbi:MAG: hypothetical protein ACI3ZL_06450 [Candidatus Cryptobacteroides sp.]
MLIFLTLLFVFAMVAIGRHKQFVLSNYRKEMSEYHSILKKASGFCDDSLDKYVEAIMSCIGQRIKAEAEMDIRKSAK